MRILITGASGNVGSGVADLLGGRHELRLSDVGRIETTHEFVRADVRRRDEVMGLADGMDGVLHTPAWHGIHRSQKSEPEYWELNVDGTFNIFQAAVAAGVRRMVWMSSEAVHNRDNIYGLTKVLGEELCAYYHRVHGMRVIMLRPWDFTPYRDRKHYGERLLRGGVDRRDVLACVALAVENDSVEFGGFPVVREDPWTPEDVEAWPSDPAGVLDRHLPGARSLVERYAFDLPESIRIFDISSTKQQLGYRPQHNFLTFLRELAVRDAAGDAEEWLGGQ